MIAERRALLSLHLYFLVQYKFFVIIIINFTPRSFTNVDKLEGKASVMCGTVER